MISVRLRRWGDKGCFYAGLGLRTGDEPCQRTLACQRLQRGEERRCVLLRNFYLVPGPLCHYQEHLPVGNLGAWLWAARATPPTCTRTCSLAGTTNHPAIGQVRSRPDGDSGVGCTHASTPFDPFQANHILHHQLHHLLRPLHPCPSCPSCPSCPGPFNSFNSFTGR